MGYFIEFISKVITSAGGFILSNTLQQDWIEEGIFRT